MCVRVCVEEGGRRRGVRQVPARWPPAGRALNLWLVSHVAQGKPHAPGQWPAGLPSAPHQTHTHTPTLALGLNLTRMLSKANRKPPSLSLPSISSTASPLQPKLPNTPQGSRRVAGSRRMEPSASWCGCAREWGSVRACVRVCACWACAGARAGAAARVPRGLLRVLWRARIRGGGPTWTHVLLHARGSGCAGGGGAHSPGPASACARRAWGCL